MSAGSSDQSWDNRNSSARELIDSQWPAIKRLRRRLISPVFRLVDAGLPLLRPLRKHILICGFPRSGTTLLQMMLENGIPSARYFGKEFSGWRAATYTWRNHEIVISKMPHDLFRLDSLRCFYSMRQADLKIILTLRDPRDVLTSQRKTGGPEGYVVGPERWRTYYRALLKQIHQPDLILVRYEQLVSDPDAIQKQVEAFTGEAMATPFHQFHTVDRPDFQTNTLNGLRPVETSLVGRWSVPQHHAYLQHILRELPELPEALIKLGYEPDTKWIGNC